ncbi:MAG: hypothetical protein JSS72_13200 [Armatimonadetes bacterium]|nr:hypothetical protein [Armatimonadota bacterium]
MKVSGHRNVTYHNQTVDGDRSSFNTLNYSGQGGSALTSNGAFTVQGSKVANLLDFRFQLADNRFTDPQDQKLTLNVKRGPVDFQAIDVEARLLNSNPFVSFSRSMRGLSLGFSKGGFDFRGLQSQTKSLARTVTIQGQGSSGPYYLETSQIVRGSEHVQIDGQTLEIGKDYAIDYEAGTITFIGRVVPQTSTIVVTFEALQALNTRGTVQGASAGYRFGKLGRLGFSVISEKKQGSAANGSRTELFQGFGAPSTPYTLQFVPDLNKPFVLRVDGLIQTLGVDFVFDAKNPAIFYMQRYVPSTSTVSVTYYPKAVASSDGDRHAVGVDYSAAISKTSHIQLYVAEGRLTNTGSPISGFAKGASADTVLAGWTLRGEIRSVPDTFVAPNTVGFNRNDQSWSFSAARKLAHVDLDFRTSNTASSSLTSEGSSSATSRGIDTSLNVDFHPLRGSSWMFTQRRTTYTAVGSASQFDTSNLSTSRKLGKLNLSVGMERLGGYALSTDTPGRVNVESDSLKLSGGYSASNAFSLTSAIGISANRAGQEKATGVDISVGTSYRPVGRLTADANYTYSKSGQLATLNGIINGAAGGYSGGGFSNGTSIDSSGIATNARQLSLLTNYRISDRASFDARFTQYSSTGSLSSNASSTTYGVGFQMEVAQRSVLSINLDRSTTSFSSGTTPTTSSSNLNSSLSGQLAKGWNYHTGYSLLLSEGGDFAQNSGSFDAGLARMLASNQRLSLETHFGQVRKYLPQDDYDVGLFYSYQLFRSMALTSSYRWRRLLNRDVNEASGSYRSRGFDIELTFDFVP